MIVSTDSLTIKYYKKVDLSDGNIMIVQDNLNLIRQIISESNRDYLTISDDGNGTIIRVKIIESTFNQDAKYYISFDNNFVKHRIYQEHLYGLNERVWSFKIEHKYIVNFSHFKKRNRTIVMDTFFLIHF